MIPVGSAVHAVTIRISTPITIETAVAVSSSKLNRNGAAMNSAAARYSMTPWTNAGIGPCLNIAGDLTRSAEEHLGRLEQLGVQQLRRGQRLVEWHHLDLRAAQRRHLAE